MKHVRISAKQREQEWNISRKELMEIVEIGILSEAELEQIISSDFNPVRSFSDHALLSTNSSFPFIIYLFIYLFIFAVQNRCGFEDKGEIWVENILHLGIS
jgi:hypothetical protein